MGIDRISGVNGYIPVQRVGRNDEQTELTAPIIAQDAFIKSSQIVEPNYVKYPYGAPELTRAVLASAAVKIPKHPEIPVEEPKDADSWIVVGKTDGAAASHNDETHHYNQQESNNPESEASDFTDELEEE